MTESAGRPLPLLALDTEFFWTSGADGVLRFQQCQACQSLIHPPAPICRYCRSTDIGVRAVSGTGTLSAFTINHRFGFPASNAKVAVVSSGGLTPSGVLLLRVDS